MRRSRIDDVARAAGVSVATVSRALRDLPNVAPATKRRIRQVAADLEYQPNPQAARLATGRTMTVGLVAPMFGSWYASQVVAGAEAVLSENGYDLLVYAVDTPRNRTVFLQRTPALGGRVDGLVLVDFFATPAQADRLRLVGKPIVTVGERVEGLDSITIDNSAGAAQAAQHLIELGHTRIGVITGAPAHGSGSPVAGEREAGFAGAVDAAGLSLDPALIVDGGFTIGGGAAALDMLLAVDEPPSAIFCLSDEMAMGAMGQARRRGVGVPDDLSIIGFDDHDLAEAAGLTTIRQPVRTMGGAATRTLLALIGDPRRTAEHVTVDVALQLRGTTRAAQRLSG